MEQKNKLSLSDVEWKEFVIGKIFNISGTVTTHPSALINGGKTPRITCAATNNGFENTYQNQPTEKGQVLTVDSATIGFVSYQAVDFIATDHVEKISMKNGNTMNRYVGLFLVNAITYSTANKYGYGYKFSQSRIAKQKILLPVTAEGAPNYAFMEAYMKQIEEKLLERYKNYKTLIFSNLSGGGVKPSIKWKEFMMKDLFYVKIGKNIDGNKIDKLSGKSAYITRKESNNGLDGFINFEDTDNFLNINYPVITIGNETAEPFVQNFPFFTGTKVNILIPKINLNEDVLFFIATSLKMHKSKYSYSFTVNSTRLKQQKILLPTTVDGKPDYVYMANYMKALEYKKLQKYFQYKGLELDEKKTYKQ